MIIGVALVVDELHKGHRLVFRYPEATPSSVLFAGYNYRFVSRFLLRLLLTKGTNVMRFHEEYMSLRLYAQYTNSPSF